MSINPSSISNIANYNVEKVYADATLSTDGSGSGETTPSIAISFPTTNLPAGFNNSTEQQTPVTDGVIAYRSNIFNLTVTNSSWYAVMLRAAKGSTSELKNGDNIVTGVGENITPNNFKENTWGYALTTIPSSDTVIDDSTLRYSTLPDSESLIPAYTSSVASSGTTEQSFKVSFAVLFSGDMPSGHYGTQVYLSAITNPAQVTSIFGTNVMQEMESAMCANAAIGSVAQLEDTRDHKKYLVAKLKDGNCWMTQNLDFDVPNILSNATSDVSSESLKTETTAHNISGWPASRSTARYYYDPGDYYYNGPTNTPHGPGESCTLDGSKNETLSKCTQFSTTGNDMYHVGNYYTWLAATAGSGESANSGSARATDSICPKNWKLPTNNQTNDASFYELLKSYNMAYSATQSGTIVSSSPIDEISYKIYNHPLYFVYSGRLIDGKLENAGYYGYYWSATPYNGWAETAYHLDFHDNVTYWTNSSYGNRSDGMPIRCVFIP